MYMLQGYPADISVGGGVTDIMDGIGDFASATGWGSTAGVSITGGVLDINTSSSFENAIRSSTNRVPCPENTTLSLEFDVTSLTTAQRVRVLLKSYNSGGTAIDSNAPYYDTNSDGAITGTGIVSKASLYTTPANTFDVQVTIEFTSSGFVGQFDDFKLTY